jgi:hypothetical protein
MIKAIETRYAGCHFRSRLEARWAVFFDALNIEWQYEPEAFSFTTNVPLDDTDTTWQELNYLPDFYLPKSKTWVEVKGCLDDVNWDKLVWAVDFGNLPGVEDGWGSPEPLVPGLLLLGNVPRPVDALTPTFPILQHNKGGVVEPAFFTPEGLWTQRQLLDSLGAGLPPLERSQYVYTELLYRDVFEACWGDAAHHPWVDEVKRMWPEDAGWMQMMSRKEVMNAFTAARSARFGT